MDKELVLPSQELVVMERPPIVVTEEGERVPLEAFTDYATATALVKAGNLVLAVPMRYEAAMQAFHRNADLKVPDFDPYSQVALRGRENGPKNFVDPMEPLPGAIGESGINWRKVSKGRLP